MSTEVDAAPSPAGPVRGVRTRSPVLAVLVCLVIGLAPVEGYLLAVAGPLVKAPAALLVVAWAVQRWRTRSMLVITPVTVLCMLLAGAVLASTALNTGSPYVLEYLVRWISFLVTCAVLIDVLAQDVAPSVGIGAAAVGALAAATGALYSFLVLGDPRASGPMEDPNDLAYVLVSAVPLMLLGGRGRAGLARSAAAVVIVAGALVTVSRGGLVALAVLVLWAAAHRLLRARAVVATIVAGVLALGVVGVAASEVVSTALTQKSYIGGNNVASRELRWEAAARQLSDFPVLGVGPGGTRDNYPAYSDNAELDEQQPVAHNMYVEVAAEGGVVGFGLFVGVIAAALLATIRVVAQADGVLRRHGLAVQGALLAAATASTFLSEQYYMTLWGAVAIAASLAVRARVDPWNDR